MKFSANGYYIEKYIKCMNCGLLIYGKGVPGKDGVTSKIFCSQWCVEWAELRDSGAENIRLPLNTQF